VSTDAQTVQRLHVREERGGRDEGKYRQDGFRE
jgi:hypothetical protein